MSQKKQIAYLNVLLAEQAQQIEAEKGELRGAHEKLKNSEEFFYRLLYEKLTEALLKQG